MNFNDDGMHGNKETETLRSTFVITALEHGQRVYAAIDSHSGGYPYWSRTIDVAGLSLAIDMHRIMAIVKLLRGKGISEVCVAEVKTTLVLTPISTIEIEAEEAQKEIDTLEAELAEKRKKLNNILKG